MAAANFMLTQESLEMRGILIQLGVISNTLGLLIVVVSALTFFVSWAAIIYIYKNNKYAPKYLEIKSLKKK